MKGPLWATVAMAALLAMTVARGRESGQVGTVVSPPLTLAIADRMIASCLDHQMTGKTPPIAIAVVDAAGALLSYRREDKASPLTGDIAVMKARTALQARASTSALGSYATQDARTRDALIALRLTDIPGGVPFAPIASIVIGAVGVSGGTADQDESCAQRAIDVGVVVFHNIGKQ